MNTNEIKAVIKQHRDIRRQNNSEDSPSAIDEPFAPLKRNNGLAFDIFDPPAPPPILPRIHKGRGALVNNGSPPPSFPLHQQNPRRPLESANTPREDKSDVVRKIEAMQAQREERRRRASAAKAQRAKDAQAAQDAGTNVEAVEFLGKLIAYRRAHGIAEARPWAGDNVWDNSGEGSIRVCVRKRPMLKVERQARDYDVVDITSSGSAVVVHEPKTKVDMSKDVESHTFGLDACFNEVDSNETIHKAVLSPLLRHVMGGGTATVFAFGQTGSGKTCTLSGHGDQRREDGNAAGLYSLAARELMGAAGACDGEVRVGVSFYEIYRGHVLDLLAERRRLEVQEDGRGHVQLPGLASVPVTSEAEMMAAIGRAEQRRVVGCTSANETSSRSHAVLQVTLTGSTTGKLLLVDLAGSERASDSTSRDRQTRIEGAEINKSLLALKECIRSLDGHGTHVPFRGSKLTHVLREAFIGRAKTCMIATVAPGAAAAEHTLNTLRYAQRVRAFATDEPPRKPPAAQPPATKSPEVKPPLGSEPPESQACKPKLGLPSKRVAAARSPPAPLTSAEPPPRSAPAALSDAVAPPVAALPSRAAKGRRTSADQGYAAERAMYNALAGDAHHAFGGKDAMAGNQHHGPGALQPIRPLAAMQGRQRQVFTATKAW